MSYIKSLRLTPKQWEQLHERLKNDYPLSTLIIRDKMRRELGFVVREHQNWLGYWDDASIEDRKQGRHGYKTVIYLDFYNEPMQTMFLLKYSEYFNE